ncbi:unnamed protein product [Mortierella alpina]
MTVKHKAIKFNIKATTASIDPDSEPIIYGTPESPARIEGEVVLECNYECKGTVFVLSYAAVVDDYHTDSTYFDKREFHHELLHPPGRPNHLAPNVYRFPFAFIVSSEYPSSFDSNGARMRYVLEGRLKRKRSRAFKKTLVVHVYNTAMAKGLISTSSVTRAPSGSALGLQVTGMNEASDRPCKDLSEPGKVAISSPLWSPSETTLAVAASQTTLQRFPGVWAGRWPYEVLFPTLTLLWGHILPITVRIYSPCDSSVKASSGSHSPQSCSFAIEKVVRINVSVEQATIIHAGVSVCTSRHKILQAAWDCLNDDVSRLLDLAKPSLSQDDNVQARAIPWQKVLLFQTPLADASRTLPPTIDCKCLKIDYFLKVTLDLITTQGKHSEPIEGKNNSDEWVELQVMF